MCSNSTVPSYLHQDGRPVVSDFEPTELLFRRYPKEPLVVPGTSQISSSAICLREDSYNRELFSHAPTDVLYDETHENNTHYYADWGIVAFQYAQLDRVYAPSDPKDSRRFRASVVHAPNACMYPHCQQEVTEETAGASKVEPPKSVKLKMRNHMGDICKVVKNAPL